MIKSNDEANDKIEWSNRMTKSNDEIETN